MQPFYKMISTGVGGFGITIPIDKNQCEENIYGNYELIIKMMFYPKKFPEAFYRDKIA